MYTFKQTIKCYYITYFFLESTFNFCFLMIPTSCIFIKSRNAKFFIKNIIIITSLYLSKLLYLDVPLSHTLSVTSNIGNSSFKQ